MIFSKDPNVSYDMIAVALNGVNHSSWTCHKTSNWHIHFHSSVGCTAITNLSSKQALWHTSPSSSVSFTCTIVVANFVPKLLVSSFNTWGFAWSGIKTTQRRSFPSTFMCVHFFRKILMNIFRATSVESRMLRMSIPGHISGFIHVTKCLMKTFFRAVTARSWYLTSSKRSLKNNMLAGPYETRGLRWIRKNIGTYTDKMKATVFNSLEFYSEFSPAPNIKMRKCPFAVVSHLCENIST